MCVYVRCVRTIVWKKKLEKNFARNKIATPNRRLRIRTVRAVQHTCIGGRRGRETTLHCIVLDTYTHASNTSQQQLSLMGRDAINRHTHGSDRPDEIGRSNNAPTNTEMAENRNHSCQYPPSLSESAMRACFGSISLRASRVRRWNPPGCISSGI